MLFKTKNILKIDTPTIVENDYINASIVFKAYGANINLWRISQNYNSDVEIVRNLLKLKNYSSLTIDINNKSKDTEMYNGLYVHPLLLFSFLDWLYPYISVFNSRYALLNPDYLNAINMISSEFGDPILPNIFSDINNSIDVFNSSSEITTNNINNWTKMDTENVCGSKYGTNCKLSNEEIEIIKNQKEQDYKISLHNIYINKNNQKENPNEHRKLYECNKDIIEQHNETLSNSIFDLPSVKVRAISESELIQKVNLEPESDLENQYVQQTVRTCNIDYSNYNTEQWKLDNAINSYTSVNPSILSNSRNNNTAIIVNSNNSITNPNINNSKKNSYQNGKTHIIISKSSDSNKYFISKGCDKYHLKIIKELNKNNNELLIHVSYNKSDSCNLWNNYKQLMNGFVIEKRSDITFVNIDEREFINSIKQYFESNNGNIEYISQFYKYN